MEKRYRGVIILAVLLVGVLAVFLMGRRPLVFEEEGGTGQEAPKRALGQHQSRAANGFSDDDDVQEVRERVPVLPVKGLAVTVALGGAKPWIGASCSAPFQGGSGGWDDVLGVLELGPDSASKRVAISLVGNQLEERPDPSLRPPEDMISMSEDGSQWDRFYQVVVADFAGLYGMTDSVAHRAAAMELYLENPDAEYARTLLGYLERSSSNAAFLEALDSDAPGHAEDAARMLLCDDLLVQGISDPELPLKLSRAGASSEPHLQLAVFSQLESLGEEVPESVSVPAIGLMESLSRSPTCKSYNRGPNTMDVADHCDMLRSQAVDVFGLERVQPIEWEERVRARLVDCEPMQGDSAYLSKDAGADWYEQFENASPAFAACVRAAVEGAGSTGSYGAVVYAFGPK